MTSVKLPETDQELGKESDQERNQKIKRPKRLSINKQQDDVEKKGSVIREIIIDTPEPLWTTRAIANDFGREVILNTTFREGLIHLIFVILITIAIFGRQNPNLHEQNRMIIFHGTQRFTTVEFFRTVRVDQIKTLGDIWEYLYESFTEFGYVDAYYSSFMHLSPLPEKERLILFANKLMGVPRLTQVRTRNQSCKVEKNFQPIFSTCYATYSWHTKENRSFGIHEGTAWTYQDKSTSKSLPYHGKMASYDGSGYYQDLKTDLNETDKIIAELKNHLWLDPATSALFLDFLIFNPTYNLFSQCKLVFEIPPSGGVLPTFEIQTFDLFNIETSLDYATVTCEVLSFVMICWCLVESCRELLYFRLRYFKKFWTFIDLAICSSGIAAPCVGMLFLNQISADLKTLEKSLDQHINLELAASWKRLYTVLTAFILFLVYAKSFKYLSFNKILGQLNNTLKKCVGDIIGFSAMFFIIFFTFALTGYILFGSQAKEFSTFERSLVTLLRTILGEFDYEVIEKANKSIAPIYFLAYVIIIFFILLNMFLAIISDAYTVVKTEIAIAPAEMQMQGFLKKSFVQCTFEWGCRKLPRAQSEDIMITIQQCRDALKKFNFDDIQIEMFFKRFDVSSSENMDEQRIKKLVDDLIAYSKDDGSRSKEKEISVVQLGDIKEQLVKIHEIETYLKLVIGRVSDTILKLECAETSRIDY